MAKKRFKKSAKKSKKSSKKTKGNVAIVMGSDSDWAVLKDAKQVLKLLSIKSEASVLSAHRTPDEAAWFAKSAKGRGFSVIIAGAGLAAHLAGAMAAHSELPVIGVPMSSGPLRGMDALLATVQMPKGVPVATVALDGAWNAGILAAQILALQDQEINQKLKSFRLEMRKKALSKKLQG